MPETIAEIEELFSAAAEENYGEQVTMAEHMLLTAQSAVAAGARSHLVAASLLHDIGHLLVAPDDEYGKHTHDEIGAEWVARRFPAEVSEPIRLHVEAKRYLCRTEPGYFDRLSSASRYTLGKQGGPMTSEEIHEFESLPHHEDAIRMRRWEDAHAKTKSDDVPSLERFIPVLEELSL